MSFYLVLGAGRFGRLALERLGKLDKEAKFLIVDRDPQALAAIRVLNPPVGIREAEAARFLAENLHQGCPWDWIIPMAPVHAAYAWLRQGPLGGAGWQSAPVPEAVGNLAPAVIRGEEGELYLSYSDHLCPDDCPEPDICPVSGEGRGTPLYEALAAIRIPGCRILVMVSRQLAPGVGGYPPGELLRLALEVGSCTGKFLIATACRCHGVVHGLEREVKQ
ncbi:MAG: hypothetical protein FJ126_11100 [Deltaproteobacteria bacterium]|nr:hypothetical protein [Deltaproteobacteria bacterium]